jgi:hypothetical protein
LPSFRPASGPKANALDLGDGVRQGLEPHGDVRDLLFGDAVHERERRDVPDAGH